MANLTISPTVVKVLQVIKMGKAITPSEINAHVGDGDYASKHVWYLGKLGFQFSIQKDGRKVSSYTLIAEPDNAEAIRNTVHGAAKAKAPKASKAPKAPAARKVKAKVVKTKVMTDTDKAAIKAKNLQTLKAVAAKRKAAPKKKVREFDDVTEQFGTSGEVATSFNVDRDWDSVEGLDLSKLL
jgi:hypothetical protein